MLETFADRDRSRSNNFGALRLILALFVLFSHTFAAYYGTHEGVEPIHRLTRGQLDLSGFAVNAFFAISGYLITLSWLRTPNFKTYMMKRVLRIYPGFIIASLVSLVIVAPLAGAHWSVAFAPNQVLLMIARIVVLSDPKAHGAFAGAPMEVLNLSLWTIRYEFICYLMVPLVVVLLGRTGHLRSGVTLIYLGFLAWHASQGTYLANTGARQIPLLGSADVWPRFGTYFAGGMVLAFNADRIPCRRWIAALSVIMIAATAWYGKGLFLAIATGGMYLVYYAAYQRTLRLSHIGERLDLSYGVYLYAWPVQNLLVYYFGQSLNVWTLIALAFVITPALAIFSWYFVEGPFLVKKAKLIRKHASSNAAPAPAPPAGLMAYAPPLATSDMASMIISVRETQKA